MLYSLYKKENSRETVKKIYYFLDQKPFAHFWKIKENILQPLISKFMFDNFSFKYKDGFSKFTIFILFFWKLKTLRARGRKCRFFGIELLKIYLIDSLAYCVVFEIRKIVQNHSTHLYTVYRVGRDKWWAILSRQGNITTERDSLSRGMSIQKINDRINYVYNFIYRIL